MRFIEPIVPGIQVHRHNRYVSIPDTVERRYSIDFQFLDDVALVCANPGYVCWKGPVSIYASPRCFQRYIRRIVSVDSDRISRGNFCPVLLCRFPLLTPFNRVIPIWY